MEDWVDIDLFRWWMNSVAVSPAVVLVWLAIDLWVSR